ncbi:cold shock CspA family protein [Arthrobacter stackebrandtii]|uniref:Cold shock CspA family protein n=1 Tax=Arthrobacter stackebrandtii TaxID=272161 RepID=A0ABS4YUI9_9MICC|nr:cold shock CspA family protein [Arthrobacter stackebrandtii]
METTGTVRLWNDEEGWGVIDSDATPGGSWAHYSDVAIAG